LIPAREQEEREREREHPIYANTPKSNKDTSEEETITNNGG